MQTLPLTLGSESIGTAIIVNKMKTIPGGIWRLTLTQGINRDGFLTHSAPLYWWLKTLQ